MLYNRVTAASFPDLMTWESWACSNSRRAEKQRPTDGLSTRNLLDQLSMPPIPFPVLVQ